MNEGVFCIQNRACLCMKEFASSSDGRMKFFDGWTSELCHIIPRCILLGILRKLDVSGGDQKVFVYHVAKLGGQM